MKNFFSFSKRLIFFYRAKNTLILAQAISIFNSLKMNKTSLSPQGRLKVNNELITKVQQLFVGLDPCASARVSR